MIAYKGRDVKRGRKTQMARNLERLYKEGKCRDCSVIVTRMDFAKILGKFTKVKIQYENVSSPKTKKVTIKVDSPPIDTSRLKTNENGMVLFRRSAYNKHPINNSQLLCTKKAPSETIIPRLNSNVLKENNALTKTVIKDKNSNYNTKAINSNTKQYTIIFVDPKINNNRDILTKIQLTELLSQINNTLLPAEEWSIHYLPKTEPRQEDKVYDRIEAELEGLMFSEKQDEKLHMKPKIEENKSDEFPSIMDILNDTYSPSETKQNDPNVLIEFKSNLESSDVEAMLLGKSSNIVKISEATPMEVDSTVMNNLIENVDKISAVASIDKNIDTSEEVVELSLKENPQSPSILDGALEKGEEEHIPAVPEQTDTTHIEANTAAEEGNKTLSSTQAETKEIKMDVDPLNALTGVPSGVCNPDVTHVIFKKLSDGVCTKSVTCPKNLKYAIEIEGKPVELLGAPKQITCIEDLQVLLQIVNESELDSLYVLH